jgi:hypothetical protein
VADFCAEAISRFRSVGARISGGDLLSQEELPGVVPLLARSWPGPTPGGLTGCRGWAAACQALAKEDRVVEQIAAQWAGKRTTAEPAWRLWWSPSAEVSATVPLPAAVWGRFAMRRPQAGLDEQFDHAAAAIYFATHDPAWDPDQLARIARVLPTRYPAQWPARVPPIVQDPDEGSPSLAVLTWGKYGLFKWLNSPPRLAAPLPGPPPDDLGVHLCWVTGYQGVSKEVVWSGLPSLHKKAAGGNRAPAATLAPSVSQASVLQGLIGLVLDDWRSMLAGQALRVKFHLHRDWPQSACADLGPPGRRWKTEALEPAGTVPPAALLGLLFQRCSHVDAASRPFVWPTINRQESGDGDWWCGFILRADLEALGFDGRVGVASAGAAVPPFWLGPANALPDLSQIIVLDPEACSGAVYNLLPSDKSCRLCVIGVPRRQAKRDRSFSCLRQDALQALVGALVARGHF